MITAAIYQEQTEIWKPKGLKEGLYFLSRSLIKTLAKRYGLGPTEARQLVAAVAGEYKKELGTGAN